MPNSRNKPKSKPDTAALQAQLAAAQAAVDELRAQLESQTIAATAHQARLAAAVPTHRAAYGELMVGIRNVSDTAIGIPPQFKGDDEIQLFPDFGNNEPRQVAVISYGRWRELRKGTLVERGLIVRDDSVLGRAYSAAPADQDHELPPNAKHNVIPDPVAWIESRTEAELRADLARITAEEGLRRLRRAVDQRLRQLELKYPRETLRQQADAARRALAELPANYRLIDELVEQRIQDLFTREEDGPIKA